MELWLFVGNALILAAPSAAARSAGCCSRRCIGRGNRSACVRE